MIQWIKNNLAGIIGMVQAVLKCIKEIATALINLFSFLNLQQAQIIVNKVRDIVNKIDEFIENWKSKLI